jgi:hypothetical protein
MKRFALAMMVCEIALSHAQAETEALITFDHAEALEGWTFEFGVSLMTKNEIDDFLEGNITVEDGDAGAEIYQFTATKMLSEWNIELFGQQYHPLLEMPLCLELVDENANDPFLTYNAALQLRWVDFPWNAWVQTSFAAGLGLSYATEIYAMDKQRHPNENRSNLKFNLPIQFTFALPSAPEHQVNVYIAHHSGGFGIFDVGGFNSIGLSYAYKF